MKNIIKTLALVMTLVIAIVAFTACDLFGEKDCTHEGTVAILEAVAPTCTESGLTEGSYCTACNTVIVAQETVAATGHNMVSQGFDENGTETLVCGNSCGETTTRLVQLPEVVVNPVENADLTFALNFTIKDLANLSEEYLNALFTVYGEHYVDYVLTIEGLTDTDVTFNANGADGYLSGQYDAWSENWVNVPFEDVTVANGESVYIMELAAKLMNKTGLRCTLYEVAELVQDFDCGVYFTPEFLAANPNMKVTLQLIVFTEDAEGNKTLVGDAPVAENVFTVAE